KPGDDGERILLFLLGVLVAYQSLGIARAANVDTNTGVAVPGEIMVHGRVAATHEIALAIGKVFEERRHRPERRIGRQPDSCRQPHPVRECDPFVLDHPHRTRELGNGLHRAFLYYRPGRRGALAIRWLSRRGARVVSAYGR